MARRQSKVTEQQSKYIDGLFDGKSRNESAIAAGYPNSSSPDGSVAVREEIARVREQLTDLTTIRRVTVVDGIMDGIALARMQGDAGNVIKGWTEVGKMLGHYAPEVKTINLNIDQQRMLAKFEALSDDELLAIQNGNIIDVDVKKH